MSLLFPDDILVQILSRTSLSKIKTLRLVSKQFNRIISSPECWKDGLIRFLGILPLSRLAPSYRDEYFIRSRLSRQYKTPIVYIKDFNIRNCLILLKLGGIVYLAHQDTIIAYNYLTNSSTVFKKSVACYFVCKNDILVACEDGSVSLINENTTFPLFMNPITACFLFDSKLVVGFLGEIILVDGKVDKKLKFSLDKVIKISRTSDRIVIVLENLSVITTDCNLDDVIYENENSIENSKFILTNSTVSYFIKIYSSKIDFINKSTITSFDFPEVTCAKWTAGDNCMILVIATLTGISTYTIHQTRTYKLTRVYDITHPTVSDIVLDDYKFVTKSDKIVRVWNTTTGTLISSFKDRGISIATSIYTCKETIVSCGGCIRIVDYSKQEKEQVLVKKKSRKSMDSKRSSMNRFIKDDYDDHKVEVRNNNLAREMNGCEGMTDDEMMRYAMMVSGSGDVNIESDFEMALRLSREI